mgnify:CR=1 FL=1
MRYALLIYGTTDLNGVGHVQADAEASGVPSPSLEREPDEFIAYTRALKDAGALVALQRLQAIETATTVRLRGGERLLTDGPFVETKEHLLGFYLVDVDGLDAALEWAARMPILTRKGTVEVRPIFPSPRLDAIAAE